MVAGEQRAAFDEREAQVVRRVPRRRDRFQRPTVAGNALAVGEHAVGGIVGVEGRIGARPVVLKDQRRAADDRGAGRRLRSEEHTSELQSLMRISYAVFCLKKKTSTYQLARSK